MPTINTNLAANTALLYTNNNTNAEQKLLAQLSSGLRVQTASDDPAANSIATKIQSDSNTLAQAAINAQTAQAVLNTANGGYEAIVNILQQLETVTAAAQAGTLDSGSFTNLNLEYQALVSEIGSVASQTQFNGVSLLDGSGSSGDFSSTGGATILLGTTSADTLTIATKNCTITSLGVSTNALTSAAVASSNAALLATAITTLAGYEAQGGADSSRVGFRLSLINVSKQNDDASVSALVDADVAQVQTSYTSTDTLTQAGIAALQKANAIPQELLRLLQS